MEIEVFVFLPPFSNEVTEEISQSDELKKWWEDYWDIVPKILTTQGFKVLVVRNPSILGLDDRYMLDGFHPSEVFVAVMLLDWLENVSSSSMLSSIDLGHLKSLLNNSGVLPVGFGCEVSEFSNF